VWRRSLLLTAQNVPASVSRRGARRPEHEGCLVPAMLAVLDASRLNTPTHERRRMANVPPVQG
jgi:hypothetical protein